MSAKKKKEKRYLGWSEWKPFIDGWIPKFSFFVPIIGYYILFNDTVLEFLKLNYLTGNQDEPMNLNLKIYGLYFGLFFLGISNIFYHIKKPSILKLGIDQFSYSEKALRSFSFSDFNSIYRNLNDKNFQPSWEPFKKDFDGNLKANLGISYVGRTTWSEIISKHEEYLRNLLQTVFCVENSKRRAELLFCIALSSFGYFFLFAVSFSTFISVTISALKKIFGF